MPEVASFKDISITFKKHPVTDDIVQVKDRSAIAQAIKSLLLTRKGERPFKPNFGSGLQKALFEPLDYGSAVLIKNEINTCLSIYEPRIVVRKINCLIDYNNNGYDIELEYRIKGRTDRPVAIEFFLERTR